MIEGLEEPGYGIYADSGGVSGVSEVGMELKKGRMKLWRRGIRRNPEILDTNGQWTKCRDHSRTGPGRGKLIEE